LHARNEEVQTEVKTVKPKSPIQLRHSLRQRRPPQRYGQETLQWSLVDFRIPKNNGLFDGAEFVLNLHICLSQLDMSTL